MGATLASVVSPQPICTLASSSRPLKNSLPTRLPTANATLLEIDPTAALLANDWPSTTTLIALAVFTHCTVCQRPSLIAGPGASYWHGL